jgi:hypothetical protein
VIALRNEEATLRRVEADLEKKKCELETVIARYMDRKQSPRLQVEVQALLNEAQMPNDVSQADIEKIEHDIRVHEAAIAEQRKIVSIVRSRVSVKIQELNRGHYLEIVRKIHEAVVALASANQSEVDFFDELRAAGCDSIQFRPMRVTSVGLARDQQGVAALHRREVAQFVPDAMR